MWIKTDIGKRLINLKYAVSMEIYYSTEITDEAAPFLVYACFTTERIKIAALKDGESAKNYLAELCDKLNMRCSV